MLLACSQITFYGGEHRCRPLDKHKMDLSEEEIESKGEVFRFHKIGGFWRSCGLENTASFPLATSQYPLLISIFEKTVPRCRISISSLNRVIIAECLRRN